VLCFAPNQAKPCIGGHTRRRDILAFASKTNSSSGTAFRLRRLCTKLVTERASSIHRDTGTKAFYAVLISLAQTFSLAGKLLISKSFRSATAISKEDTTAPFAAQEPPE
jgi:hypothetical protein